MKRQQLRSGRSFWRRGLLGLLAGLALMLTLAGCGPEEPATIRVAVLPILDALPLYVAQEQGYFEDEGLEVTLVPVASAPDRDQLINAGQADAMVNELLSNMFYNTDETQVVAVRYARKATPEFPHFYVLASGQSGITTPEELAGRDIGISEATIIEYTTDRLLQAAGLTDDQIQTVAVPRIPDRLALLQSGELDAGNMPDPLAALAIQGGAVNVIDDSQFPQYGHSVITFRKAFVDDSPDAVRGFLRAVEKAVVDINADKSAFSDLLAERQLVPPPLLGSYTLPDFPTAAVPTQEQWDDMLDWAQEKGYVTADLDYDDSVDASFLP